MSLDDDLSPTQKDSALRGREDVFLPGTVLLDRYHLEKVIGRGGMGVVWRAQDRALDIPVALKFVPQALLLDRMAIDDIKRETRRSLSLSHPHIVRVHDFIQGENWAGISMEYVGGGTLSDRRMDRESRCLEVDEIRQWVIQLCEALAYAHEKAKLIHRDLKPSNLMLSTEGDLKLADFGIARCVSDSLTRVSNQISTSGTLTHMSPQQLSGESPQVSDDVYSLGATLYDLLTGKPPFLSGSIMHQVMEKIPPPMALRRRELGVEGQPIPAVWEEVVASCLAKNPADRPATATAVLTALGLRDRVSTDPLSSRPVEHKTPETPLPGAGKIQGRLPPFYQSPGARWVYALIFLAGVLGLWFWGMYLPGERMRQSQIILHEARQKEKETEARLTTDPVRREKLLTEAREAANAAQALRTSGEKAAREAERLASARGGVIVRTEPEGAIVSLGGEDTQKSPATFRSLRLGQYPVRIALDGFDPVTVTAEVRADEFVELGPYKLVRSFGSLRILSLPEGAAFELTGSDGKTHTGKTPGEVRDIPTGPCRLTLKKSGWPDCTRLIRVERNQTTPVHWEYGPGQARFRSQPDGAEIWIGGKNRGQTPLDLELPSGTYKAEVRYKHWPVQEKTLLVTKGGTEQADFEFSSGTVQIGSTPEGAEILVDGRNMGKTPAQWELPTGTRVIKVRINALVEKSQTVEVVKGGRHEARFQLDFGRVNVESNPSGATVKIRGVAVGKTPLKGFALPPGNHSVEVSQNGYVPASESIHVREGGAERVSLTLITEEEARWKKIAGRYSGQIDVKDTHLLSAGQRQEKFEVTVAGSHLQPLVTFQFQYPITGRFTASNDSSSFRTFHIKSVSLSKGSLSAKWDELAATTSMEMNFDSGRINFTHKNWLGSTISGSGKFGKDR
ncbi:MAG: serine/threonine-protein kinase [Verrucomicrobiae bacterium]|nr:serine/threonine-protein kinase [Verrucomicrobiae bacterium]